MRCMGATTEGEVGRGTLPNLGKGGVGWDSIATETISFSMNPIRFLTSVSRIGEGWQLKGLQRSYLVCQRS